MRLVRPFLQVLERRHGWPPHRLEPFVSYDEDERVPASTMHRLLQCVVELTGDHNLGLRAARELSPGDGGAVEYVVASALTLAEGLDAGGRYLRLLGDTLELSAHVEGDHALLQLESRVSLPRAASDFLLSAVHRLLWHVHPFAVNEIWLAHARPTCAYEYDREFGPTPLRFGAPCRGFVLDARQLDVPLDRADPNLHVLMRRHADLLLAELRRTESVTERVKDVLIRELAKGGPSIVLVARRLSTSPRTLSRKLKREGTTFRALLDETRRTLALRYLAREHVGLTHIASLLGFSQAAAFHRAFKRWTGRTPAEYRNTRTL